MILKKLEFFNISLYFSLRFPAIITEMHKHQKHFSCFRGLTRPLSIEMIRYKSDFTLLLDFMTIITLGHRWFPVLEIFPEADY